MATIARDQVTIAKVIDISDSKPYYILVSNTDQPPAKPNTYPPTGWSTTEPSFDSSKKAYMTWYTEYSNGTYDYSDVSTVSSYDAAIEAWNKADNAQSSANQALARSPVYYATCSTAAATVIKDATITPAITGFTLQAGTVVYVKFSYENSGAVGSIKLRVNSSNANDAKSIKYIYNGALSNIPAVGYLKANQVYQFYYDGTYWVVELNYNTNSNNYDRMLYNQNIKAAAAVTKAHIICGTSAGYKMLAVSETFDLSYPLLYAASAIEANANNATTYLAMPGINAGTTGSITDFEARKTLYLKGTITDGNTFMIASSGWLTCTIPTSDEDYYYIPLGAFASDATSSNYKLFFSSSDKLYKFYDGSFQPISSTAMVSKNELSDSLTNIANEITSLNDNYVTITENYYDKTATDTAITQSVGELQVKVYGDDNTVGDITRLESQINQTANSVQIITSNSSMFNDLVNTFTFEGDTFKIETEGAEIHSEQGPAFYKYIKDNPAIDDDAETVFSITKEGTTAAQANVIGQVGIGSGTVENYVEQWAIRKGSYRTDINGVTGFNGYDLDFVWIGG